MMFRFDRRFHILRWAVLREIASVPRTDNVAFQPFIEKVSHPTGRGVFLRATAAFCGVACVWLLPLLVAAQQLPPSQNVPPLGSEAAQTPNPALGTISAYLGLTVREIRFTGVPVREQAHLRELVPQKVGHALDRDLLRDSIKILFDTGLFADIQVEAQKTEGDVVITFSTVGNYFVGSVT